MSLKNKTMALIRIRRTPYSGIESFMKDLFYKQEELATKAIIIIKKIYREGIESNEWRSVIKEVFNTSEPTKDDELIIEQALNNKGVYKQDIKSRTKIKQEYKELASNAEGGLRAALQKVNKWNSAVTAYYSVINKLKAIGLIEKVDNKYQHSSKFKKRLTQVVTMIEGLENEAKMK